MVDPEAASDGYEVYDQALRDWLLTAIGCRGLPEDRRTEAIRQMECPTSVGGLGLLNMKERSKISFLVSAINSFEEQRSEELDKATNNKYDRSVIKAFEEFHQSALLLPESEQDKLKKLLIWDPFNQEGKQVPLLRRDKSDDPSTPPFVPSCMLMPRKRLKFDDRSPEPAN
ncbi:MAG: hypothetical protein IPO72_19785 [Saprospiraceae bacterium]|nr:hypothetical protein [Candidatus Vicinibacter affinis]